MNASNDVVIERGTSSKYAWKATHKGEPVGLLYLHDSGVVAWIGVAKNYQRQGIATRMWDQALAENPDAKHSPCREPAGNQWALAVSDDVPTLHTIPCVLCGSN